MCFSDDQDVELEPAAQIVKRDQLVVLIDNVGRDNRDRRCHRNTNQPFSISPFIPSLYSLKVLYCKISSAALSPETYTLM